ncbi:UDP-3-O-(3-hydroxymyristoyl)glucosamine N-acyltransferase [Ornithobacterium rhinotracheale]|uniref:UDP-3-O-(3-hydroxymyristoyl)glucosamine N-acyltransferase n=1 Tax=Ornithobacterium rhinotracheale TaxID=28251 RepID=UPI001FF21001|nr:UDP-3-O-(3-hydroxymyristoyl)glucosamine N-acyltransferase [Ornithobacterium rhinotracheale]MCK0205114.1 UDP-3-O-(3-hydroxymyristoyl)glucosamine N-acyltransferase [Ornithobacterium rhinotracheale]
MRFPKPYTLEEIAKMIDAEFVGDKEFEVLGINEIHCVEPGDIVFVDHPKYYDKALQSKATIVLINKKVECPAGKALLVSDDPFRDFVKIGEYFVRKNTQNQLQNPNLEVGEGTYIAPNVFIGDAVKIGRNCYIHPNVTLGDRTVIGDNVIIHAGTVLGGDAFYYKKRESGFDKLKSVGNVVIEDDVEIGANCTIDRGVTSSTTIGAGSKLDNLIQIGHDTVVGKKCLIASQVGIAGCCVIEDEVTFWGQSGTTSGIRIGARAVIGAKSGVAKSIPGDKLYMGMPAEEGKAAYRKYAALNLLIKNKGKL